jgi:hypothetical protein
VKSDIAILLLMECPICLEDFGASTPAVPRVFPCGHGVCDVCVSALIKTA